MGNSDSPPVIWDAIKYIRRHQPVGQICWHLTVAMTDIYLWLCFNLILNVQMWHYEELKDSETVKSNVFGMTISGFFWHKRGNNIHPSIFFHLSNAGSQWGCRLSQLRLSDRRGTGHQSIAGEMTTKAKLRTWLWPLEIIHIVILNIDISSEFQNWFNPIVDKAVCSETTVKNDCTMVLAGEFCPSSLRWPTLGGKVSQKREKNHHTGFLFLFAAGYFS